jgi:hypothetical protein
MKVQDLPGWPPQPFAAFNLESLTWEQMSTIVQMFWLETKRRNPIGVNAYKGVFSDLVSALSEIAEAEKGSGTSQ